MMAALSAKPRFVAPRPVEMGPIPSKTTPSASSQQGSDRTATSVATAKSVEMRIAGEALFTIAIDLSPTFVARGAVPAANDDSTVSREQSALSARPLAGMHRLISKVRCLHSVDHDKLRRR